MMIHLVYCDNTGKKEDKVLQKILSGRKTMVVRGAAGRKIPHSRVFAGETLYFMEKGSSCINAKAVVKSAQNFVKLSDDETTRVLHEHQDKLNLSEKQKVRWHKKCLCLIEFTDVQKIDPLLFEHQGNMDDWLILENIADVVAGTSIPYHYEKAKF